MKTVEDVFTTYHRQLDNIYGFNEAEAITLLVISEISGFSKAKIKAFPEADISPGQSAKLIQALDELGTGKPVQYVFGYTEFFGLPFRVDPSVLIPRPETEELVEWVINSVRAQSFETGRILDIGTGSGCIAISLKKFLPGFNVTGIDISKPALGVARGNAQLNQVVVEFIETDILNAKADKFLPRFDIIVSNPPYVTQADKMQMHKNVTDFEPHTALFVPENDPLIFYRAIAELTLSKLNPGGLLFFEINESYGHEVVELLKGLGFKDIELRKDLAGRDRMVKGLKG